MMKVLSQQILVPKSVYIGDTAELRCTFNYDSPELSALVQNGTATLSTENFSGNLDSSEYQIKSVTLSPAGVDFYQFTITFVPWKTGKIQIPSYNIADVQIDFEVIEIESLVAQNSITSLRETNAPLLLPGTTYKLYAAAIITVVVLLFVIRAIIKHKHLMFYIRNLQLKIKYKKNASQTKKKLRALLLNERSQKDFASEVQQIMRHYLEVRFAYPFTKVVTSDLMKGYNEATLGLLSDEKEEAFESFVSAFIRTDYIRYSSNKDAVFGENELQQMVERLINSIGVIENV